MVVARTSERSSLKNILLATDFSSVSRIVLAHAVAVARRYKSKLYVAHVIPPDIYTSVPTEILQQAVKETRQHAHHGCPVSYAWEDCGGCGTKPWLERGRGCRCSSRDWLRNMPSTCW